MHLDHQKQRPVAAAAANITHLSIKAGYNTSEVFLQLFDPTEQKHSDLIGQFPVQSDRCNNEILVAYHYDSNRPGLTEILISKYLPESEITAKVHLDHQKQQPVAAAAANVTHLSIKAGYNTSEVSSNYLNQLNKNILT